MGTSANYAHLTGTGSTETVIISIPWTFTTAAELYVWAVRSSDGLAVYHDLGDFSIDVSDDFLSVEIDNPWWDPLTLTGEAFTGHILRVTPGTQTYSLAAGQPLNPTALVATLDKLTRKVQEIEEKSPRSW